MKNSKENFVVVGVNYHKTSLEVRGKFALTAEKIQKIFQSPEDCYSGRYFVLSTCNRTEVYSVNQTPEALLQLFCSFNNLTIDEVSENTFLKTGDDAVKHLFRVASGLDSQIIGDYEIVGQLKNAFNLAKTHKRTNGWLERLVNSSLQSSKQVKNKTTLSDGTASVSYAAIKQLKSLISHEKQQNICLIGVGEIGKLALKNLKHHLPEHKITITNRTDDHAKIVAEKYQVGYSPFFCHRHLMTESDILIVATAAEKAYITRAEIENTNIRLIFDLSVPCNVDKSVTELAGVKLYNVDELSQVVSQTIQQRLTEVPVAETIIDEHIQEFRDWEKRRSRFSRTTPLRTTCPLELFMPEL